MKHAIREVFEARSILRGLLMAFSNLKELAPAVPLVISAAVLGVLAKLEGKPPVQPLNTTSHWLEGEKAKERTGIDAAHTGAGGLDPLRSVYLLGFPF
jgi:hypothetical protein